MLTGGLGLAGDFFAWGGDHDVSGADVLATLAERRAMRSREPG